MRQENNHRMNSGKGENLKISNSRAMGVIILIALLFVFQVVTFVAQKFGGEVQEKGSVLDDRQTEKVHKFCFNPNTITSDSLQLLGFSPRQAGTILKYRQKGGVFREKKDFSRMYVVDSLLYVQLAPYILLPDTLLKRGVQDCADMNTGQKRVRKKGGNITMSGVQGKPGENQTRPEHGVSGEPEPGEVSGVQGESGESGVKGRTAGEGLYGQKVGRNRYVCNLNRADSADLVMLYGIGGYYAGKILSYRERLGGSFAESRQLLEIDGFGQERFEKIERNIIVLKEDIKRFSLLDAGKEFLEGHPYIGPYAARGILTYIRIKGKDSFESNFQLLQELVKEQIVTENNAQRIREYLLYL